MGNLFPLNIYIIRQINTDENKQYALEQKTEAEKSKDPSTSLSPTQTFKSKKSTPSVQDAEIETKMEIDYDLFAKYSAEMVIKKKQLDFLQKL